MTFLDQLIKYLDDKHAKNIEVLDTSKRSQEVDFMLVITALNAPHLKAINDYVEKFCFEHDYPLVRREGEPQSGWMILDFRDFFVHIFDKDTREFYDLERLWKETRE